MLESIISSTWFRLLVYLTLVIIVIKPPWLSPWISSSLPSSQKSFFSGDPWAGGHHPNWIHKSILTFSTILVPSCVFAQGSLWFTNPFWPFPPFLWSQIDLASLSKNVCDLHNQDFYFSPSPIIFPQIIIPQKEYNQISNYYLHWILFLTFSVHQDYHIRF